MNRKIVMHSKKRTRLKLLKYLGTLLLKKILRKNQRIKKNPIATLMKMTIVWSPAMRIKNLKRRNLRKKSTEGAAVKTVERDVVGVDQKTERKKKRKRRGSEVVVILTARNLPSVITDQRKAKAPEKLPLLLI